LLHKMDNGRIMNSAVIQDGFMMKTHDEEEPSKIHNDIITNH
jgi:carbonic anhydrase/acetyltransferase-like protein (isoleucine patch superfamily)